MDAAEARRFLHERERAEERLRAGACPEIEADHRSERTHLRFRALMRGMIRQPRVMHRSDDALRPQELSQLLR